MKTIKKIVSALILGLFALNCSGQIVKGSGIIYFSDTTNLFTFTPASLYGSEWAYSINQEELYRWDRTGNEWEKYPPTSGGETDANYADDNLTATGNRNHTFLQVTENMTSMESNATGSYVNYGASSMRIATGEGGSMQIRTDGIDAGSKSNGSFLQLIDNTLGEVEYTGFSVPLSVCPAGQVLLSNGTNYVCQDTASWASVDWTVDQGATNINNANIELTGSEITITDTYSLGAGNVQAALDALLTAEGLYIYEETFFNQTATSMVLSRTPQTGSVQIIRNGAQTLEPSDFSLVGATVTITNGRAPDALGEDFIIRYR